MSTLAIELSLETYQRLQERARRVGKPPESLIQDLVEKALREERMEKELGKSAREILQASGRVRPLSEALRRRIIPGVTLEEVRSALSRAGGPSLSELVLEQRGPKP
ncbi:MAG: hypothetical protein U9Q78_08760 [Chloroflexota bacterium]|nr:hypothetical protein [Chloroflexota bacterium]